MITIVYKVPMKKAFVTKIYNESLLKSAPKLSVLNKQIILEANDMKSLDGAGKKWSNENYKNGYTSYASANELHKYSPTFQSLEKLIDKHVAAYAKQLDFNLGGQPLHMVSCWINIMHKNTQHSMHLHPLSAVSGTYYVCTPKGSSPIKFEDPRISKFMASPPRKEKANDENKLFLEIPAVAGKIVLFESWLKHEVPMHKVAQPRISVSFNYAW